MFKTDRHELYGEGILRTMGLNNPKYPEGYMWDALNIVYDRSSEDPEKMHGYSRLGTTDMGGKVTGLADYAEGTLMMASCADGKFYTYNGTDWAVEGGARATGNDTDTDTRWSFAMYYGDTTAANLLVGANGIDAPVKFNGTDVTALGGSPPSTGKFPTAFAGRLWMAQGDTLFYSATNDCEVWTTTGGNFQVERGSGDITGLYVAAGNLLIFKRRKIFRLLPGTSLASTSIREVHNRIGTPSHYTIQEVGANESGTLFWVSDTGPQGITISGATGGFKPVQIAESVRPFLSPRVKKTSQATSWAHFNEDRSEYYYQYGTDSTTPSEGFIANIARHRARPRWTRHDLKGFTAGTTYRVSGEEIQAFGNADGRVYKMHVNDDREGVGYLGRIMTPGYAQGARGRMKKYGRMFIEADAQASITVRMNVQRGRAPGSGGNTHPISGIGTGPLDGWGVGTWGKAQWGGSSTTGKWVRANLAARGNYCRAIFETTSINQWFKLSGIGLEYRYLSASIAS